MTVADPPTTRPGWPTRIYDTLTAVSMTIGRRRIARAVADLARPDVRDLVIDIGCGPGTAARVARRRHSEVVGVDPSPTMLAVARRISRFRRTGNVAFVEGSAEHLPLADASATVVWSISSLHHWEDRALGVSEAQRALSPEGRLVLAERRVPAGGHGLAPHEVDQLVGVLGAMGFVDVQQHARRMLLSTVFFITGTAPRQDTLCQNKEDHA